jgi:hypothetical protein
VIPDLSGNYLGTTDFQSMHLGGLDLRRMNLEGAILDGAHFNESILCNANLRAASARGTHFDNTDLYCVDFSHSNCEEASFCLSMMTGVQCCHAHFDRCDLTSANLRVSSFTDATLRGTYFVESNLFGSNLSNADLTSAELYNSILVGCDLSGAILNGCNVYGVAAWDIKTEGAIQSNLRIAPRDESLILVDSLEVAQFIYLLVNNQKIRHIIDTITSKVVLILGRFTPERKSVLDAIRDGLRRGGYTPVLFDFEKPSNRDITETVSTLAHMARFVIADLSDPKSIPHELAHVVPLLPSVPIIPVIVRPQKEYAMFEHFFGFRHILKPFRYRSQEHLIEALETKVIAPAERLAARVAGRRSRN